MKNISNLDLHIECLEKNTGFAVANNIGARLARGKWLVSAQHRCLPRTRLAGKTSFRLQKIIPNSLVSHLVKFRQKSKLLLDGAGDAYHVSGMAWKHYLGYPADQYGLEQHEVFSPCGAAALYSRQAFLEVGGFDEDFFSYLEDVDLGFRLRLQRISLLICATRLLSTMLGLQLWASEATFAFYHYHTKSHLVICSKYATKSVMEIFVCAYHCQCNLYLNYTLQGRGKVFWKAKMDAITRVLKIYNKRREIQKKSS